MIRRDPELAPQYASQLHGAGPAEAPAAQRPAGGEPAKVMQAAKPKEEPKASEPKSRPAGGDAKTGRNAAWVVSLAVTAGVIAVIVVGVMKFMNGPVSSVASSTTLAQVKATAAPKPLTNQLAGLNFDMIYPGIFDQLGHVKNDAQAFEQYNISSKKDYRRVMAISVRPLESSNVDDDASYKLRHINPDTYKERTDKLNGERIAVMAKADKTEETLFWAHQGKLLTLSITSTNPDDVVGDFMKAVEPTLRWRQ